MPDLFSCEEWDELTIPQKVFVVVFAILLPFICSFNLC